MLGAFAAGGLVIGLGQQFVGDLGGGPAAYGMLFAAVFLGLAARHVARARGCSPGSPGGGCSGCP